MDSLLARVARNAAAHPERIALVDGERRLGYGELLARARDFAALLHRHGLQPGDRVALLLPNRIEAATACYGAWIAGAVAVPLNVQARARDFVPWLRHAGARLVVFERGHEDAEQALAELDPATVSLALEPASALCAPDAEARAGADPAPRAEPAAPALILYTSGTTGAPKGVTLSHANLLANVEAVVAYLRLEAGDSILSVLPFYYAYGSSVLHTHLLAGARVVLAPGLLFPHLILEGIARERVTGFSGVPSTFALLLERTRPQDHDLSSLRYLTQAGGAMPVALARRLRQALPGPRLFVMYGQTEATSRLTWLPPERLEEKLGSAGIPVAGVTLQIRREDGTLAAAGESGEVWARGPNVMLGYWNDPDATARTLQDGWLRTGDLGRLDAEGFLYLDGRRSDMIKTGAHRVHPQDVEEAICEVPGVVEAAAVGVDDEILGQVIKAFVVAQAPIERGAERIKAHCRRRLAPYKIPRYVEFVADLPRTASGKVRRIQLTEPQAAS